QRGAVGEPEYALAAASKKVVAMASVLSKLRQAPEDVFAPEISSAVEATTLTTTKSESGATESEATESGATESEATESGAAESTTAT
ncbi:hypothetical protein BGX31_004210, partial [Mortierella sp. GBA43]